MNTSRNVKTILAAATLAVFATTVMPADGFAAAAVGGRNGGGVSSGNATGSGGPSGGGDTGHGGGSGPVLVITDPTMGGDPQVAAVEFPPVAGPPRVRRIRLGYTRYLRRSHCAGRTLVDGDTDDVAFRACQQAAY